LSIILWNLLTLPLLFKIYQLNKLLSNVLPHIFILWNLLTLHLLFKIYQLNKLLNNVLLHIFILWNLLTLPLFRINQLSKLLSRVLLHMFILWNLLTLHLLFKSTNLTGSSAAFSEVSPSHYPSSSNSTKCSKEAGCHYGQNLKRS
jgi:hypothetical protein